MTRSKFITRPRHIRAEGAYRNAKPIEVDGITYASISAAARALGVCRSTVRNGGAARVVRELRERVESFVTDREPRRKRVGRYGSIKAAADAIGLSPAAISKRLRLEQDPLAPRKRAAPVRRLTPNEARALAKRVGVQYAAIRRREKAGTHLESEPDQYEAIPVGPYASIGEAARALGVSPGTIVYRLRTGRPYDAVKYTRAIPSSSPSVEKSASRSSPLKSIGEKTPGGQSGENR